jgi:hypothetical protein
LSSSLKEFILAIDSLSSESLIASMLFSRLGFD